MADKRVSATRRRVLIYTIVFPPDGVSTAQLLGEIAQDLAQDAHVEVITTKPHYNEDSAASSRQPITWRWHRLTGSSKFGDVEVTHLNMPAKAEGSISRIAQWLWFHIGSLVLGLRRQADVAMTVSPPPTTALVSGVLAKLGGPPTMFCVWELYPDVLVSLNKVRATSAVFRFLKMLERLTYRAADHVAFLHEGMRMQAVDTFPPLTRKSSVIPTFADTETLTPLPRETTIRASLGLPADSFVVGYAGNIGAAQDLEVLIRSAEKLRENGKVAFVVAGDGHDRERLESLVAELRLSNVHFTGHLPYEQVPEIYATFDVSVVALGAGVATEALPSKVYRTMACGRPILAVAEADSSLAAFVTEHEVGFVADPRDATALAVLISSLAADPAAARRVGVHGRQTVLEAFSREAVTKQIGNTLDELVALAK